MRAFCLFSSKSKLNTFHGFTLVFDHMGPKTLQFFLSPKTYTFERLGSPPALVLVGNKRDLVEDQQVGERKIVEFRARLRQEFGKEIPYVETSAITGENVQEMFEVLTRQLLERELGSPPGRQAGAEDSFTFNVMLV